MSQNRLLGILVQIKRQVSDLKSHLNQTNKIWKPLDHLKNNEHVRFMKFPHFESIKVYSKEILKDQIYDIQIDNENATTLTNQLKCLVIQTLYSNNLVESTAHAEQILRRLVEDPSLDQNPDNCPEFQFLTKNMFNNAIGFLNLYCHPLRTFSIYCGFANAVVRSTILESPKLIENSERFEDFLIKEQHALIMVKQDSYQKLVRELLVTYIKLSVIVNQHSGVKITQSYALTDSVLRFSEIIPLKTNNRFFFVIECAEQMLETINDMTKTSYSIYLGVSQIYSQFLREVENYRTYCTTIQGIEELISGKNISDIIEQISAKQLTDQKLLNQGRLIAASLMIIALNGTGHNAGEKINFYGLNISPNCLNNDKNLLIFTTKNVNQINDLIRVEIQNLICDIENKSSQNIGNFDAINFENTVYSYYDTLKSNVELKSRELQVKVFNLMNSIQREIENFDKETTKSTRKCCSKNIINDLNEIEGIEAHSDHDNVDITIKNSNFKIPLKQIVNVIPDISESILSTIAYRDSKKKLTKFQSKLNLIKFYSKSRSLMKIERIVAVFVKICENKKMNIQPIILDY